MMSLPYCFTEGYFGFFVDYRSFIIGRCAQIIVGFSSVAKPVFGLTAFVITLRYSALNHIGFTLKNRTLHNRNLRAKPF
jgi:hypothetical protein